MFAKLFPRDAGFYDHLDAQMTRAVEAASALVEAVSRGVVDRPLLEKIEGIARASSQSMPGIVERLHGARAKKTALEDARKLAAGVDDIVRRLHSMAKRLHAYHLAPNDKELAGFSRVIQESVCELAAAAKHLRNPERREALEETCRSIDRLVKVGGEMHDDALANLFDNECDAVSIIKWKEIYEDAGAVIASCGGAAAVVSAIAGRKKPLSP